MQHLEKTPIFVLLGIIVLMATTVLSSPVPTAHQEAACGPCHKMTSFSSESGSGSVASPANMKCLECHQTDKMSQNAFHASASGRCLDCHVFHNPDKIAISPENNLLIRGDDIAGAHCQSCHDSRGRLTSLSPSHKVAANLYHNEAGSLGNTSPSQACLRCHSGASNSSWQTATEEGILAFNTHASHPFGIRVIPGQGNSTNRIRHDIDPRLPLFDGMMECQTCHLLTAGNEDLMIPFPAKYDLCNGCHEHNEDRKFNPADLMATIAPR